MNDTNPVVRYWSVTGPKGEVVVCQLVRTSHGLEVQCISPTSERLLLTSSVKTLHDGFNVSESWRAKYAANGWHPRAENG